MREVILQSPEQITHSIDVNKSVTIDSDYDSIILAGMGGSGHPGDLLNALGITKLPLTVHRSYGLPKIYGSKPLLIASSYSGNTEESITAYQEAKSQGYGTAVNTAGGKLADFAKQDGAPLITIDYPGMQPRHTLFASFTGLATALGNSDLAENITEELKRTAASLTTSISTLEEPARALAKQLKNKVPIFTASNILAFAAKNFKIQTNENAKTPAFWNDFPELNHNEMVGFSHPTPGYVGQADPKEVFHVVMLRDEQDHPRTKARMDVTKETYQSWGIEVTEFPVVGNSLVEKLFYAVSFGMWITYYLALEYNIDPIPVEGVENFKKKLEEIAGKI